MRCITQLSGRGELDPRTRDTRGGGPLRGRRDDTRRYMMVPLSDNCRCQLPTHPDGKRMTRMVIGYIRRLPLTTYVRKVRAQNSLCTLQSKKSSCPSGICTVLAFEMYQIQSHLPTDWKILHFSCSFQPGGTVKCTHKMHGSIAGLQTCDLHALHTRCHEGKAHKCTHTFHGNMGANGLFYHHYQKSTDSG